MKKAYLVTCSFITRVIADENADEEVIAKLAETNIINKIENGELLENIEDIKEDTEVPYNKEYDEYED